MMTRVLGEAEQISRLKPNPPRLSAPCRALIRATCERSRLSTARISASLEAGAGHIKLAVAPQGLHQQLGVHRRVVCGEDADAVLLRKAGQLSHDRRACNQKNVRESFVSQRFYSCKTTV